MNRIPLIVFTLILVSACSDNSPVPWFTQGRIEGRVEIDANDETYPDNSGVEVTCFGAYGSLITQTNENGFYSFDSLGNGTYELFFDKESFGSVHMYSVQVFGYDTVYASEVTMFQSISPTYTMPEFTGIIDSYSPESWDDSVVAIITNVLTTDSNIPEIRMYFDESSEVNNDDNFHTLPAYILKRNGYSYFIYYFTTEELPFEKGQEVFFKAYICNQNDNGYWDPYKRKYIFSTLDENRTSTVFSFKMP